MTNCWNTNCNIFAAWPASYIGLLTFDEWNCEPSSSAIFLWVSHSKRTAKVTTKIPIYEQNIQKSPPPHSKGQQVQVSARKSKLSLSDLLLVPPLHFW